MCAAGGQLPPGWRCDHRAEGFPKWSCIVWLDPDGKPFNTVNEVMQHLGLPQQHGAYNHFTTASELLQAEAEAGSYGLNMSSGPARSWKTAVPPSGQPAAPEAPASQQPAVPVQAGTAAPQTQPAAPSADARELMYRRYLRRPLRRRQTMPTP